MNPNTYHHSLQQISTRVYSLGNYGDYELYKRDWDTYFHEVYLPNYDPAKEIRIFFAESAPQGRYPNRNYIFDGASLSDRIDDITDMYLYRYYRGIFSASQPAEVRQISKKEGLINLAQHNVLIMDLLPTHGIKLTTNERENIKNNLTFPLNLAVFGRLENKMVNYALSVPPTLFENNKLQNILETLLPNFTFKNFGNVNTGQGHAPSIEAIISIVKKGF